MSFALSALPFVLCVSAEAQKPEKIPRIAYLTTTFSSEAKPRVHALRQGLGQLGYVEGQNITIEYKYADGNPNRLKTLADELVNRKVDLIVTHGFPPARAAKEATTTVPIVMAVIGDAVGAGLVQSLARPGGNITGLTSISSEMYGKRLDLIKEISPKISRVAVLSSDSSPPANIAINEIRTSAARSGVQIQLIQVSNPHELETAFDTATKTGAGALMVLQGPLTSSYRKQIVELAGRARLITTYHESEFTDVGGLMSYGVSYTDMYRRAGYLYR